MDFLFSADTQEKIALLIVGSVALYAAYGIYRATLAPVLADFLLRRGRVGLAMRVKAHEKQAGCGSCGPAGGGCAPDRAADRDTQSPARTA